MKKYAIIAAMFMAFCASVSLSACSASGRVGTKHHGVGASGQVG